jgi:hypothetical protein
MLLEPISPMGLTLRARAHTLYGEEVDRLRKVRKDRNRTLIVRNLLMMHSVHHLALEGKPVRGCRARRCDHPDKVTQNTNRSCCTLGTYCFPRTELCSSFDQEED